MKKKLLIAILCCGAMATNAENPRYTGTSMSIEDALDAVGVNGRFENRKSIAENNGIKKYKGTDKQNLYMLDLLKEGNLIIDDSCYYTEEELAEKQREAANETSAEAPAATAAQEPEVKEAPQEEPRLTLQSENPALKLPQYAGNPNETVGKALKSTGALSMAIGVPCFVAGVACLMYANMKANPTDGYTTSRSKADADGSLEYISVDEWNNKMQKFTRSTHNAEVAGYILTPMGGALTVIGVPLYVKGKKMMQLDVNYTGNGAGISVEF